MPYTIYRSCPRRIVRWTPVPTPKGVGRSCAGFVWSRPFFCSLAGNAMHKVVCLIDGFNLYHGIAKLDDEKYKWCNYRKLAKRFLEPHQNLVRVVYFTAYADWVPERAAKHKKLVEALRGVGVDTVLGQFKEVTRFCAQCRKKYTAHEEKETDVNLAAYLLHMAHMDQFDTALVISADSDFASVIALVRESFPRKKVGVVIPVKRWRSDRLASVASFVRYMKEPDLRYSLLPEKITLKDGYTVVRPKQYNP